MATRVKVQPLDTWLEITVDAALSPAARSKAVAEYARRELRGALDRNRRTLGADTPYRQTVDGRAGAALESVNPDRGRIVFEFELIRNVLDWIMAELVRRSPHGPAGGAGTYHKQHVLLADGVETALADDMPAASEYVILNTTPYARKIEIGVTQSGRSFVINAEPRLYDSVSHEAALRFSRAAKISYTFRALAGGHQVRTKRGTRAMRYPAIVVRPR